MSAPLCICGDLEDEHMDGEGKPCLACPCPGFAPAQPEAESEGDEGDDAIPELE